MIRVRPTRPFALKVYASAAALAVLLATPASALVIRNDPGGPVAERVAQIATLSTTGQTVKILGRCASSCTMLLSIACVAPSARLGFHGPSSQYPGIALPPAEFERVSRQMATHYPPAIRTWFLREARLVTGDLLTLTGAEAIRLGAKKCG